MPYASACKVALEYRTRFWEKFSNPIYGSCSTSTDIPGIGSVCYPSSNINGSGPASLLASYEIGRPYGSEWAGIPEEQHVQYVIDAMVDIHGEVAREEFTGKWKRKCWSLDEFSNGGWASPAVGNHETYLPSFFETHSHVSISCVACLSLEGEMIDVWIDDLCGRAHILHTRVDCLSHRVWRSR